VKIVQGWQLKTKHAMCLKEAKQTLFERAAAITDLEKQVEEYVWESRDCTYVNPIVDSKGVVLSALGSSQPCRSIRRDMSVEEGIAYEMTTDFYNQEGNLCTSVYGRVICGHLGFVFNYRDHNNYDIIWKRVHDDSYGYGKHINGKHHHYNSAKNNAPIVTKKWYSLKIEVAANKNVKVFMDRQLLGSFTAYFPTKGYGGVAVWNGYKNVGQFKHFNISAISH